MSLRVKATLRALHPLPALEQVTGDQQDATDDSQYPSPNAQEREQYGIIPYKNQRDEDRADQQRADELHDRTDGRLFPRILA